MKINKKIKTYFTKQLLSIICIIVFNISFSQDRYFTKFENIDSLSCFDYKYPFYYQMEKDTLIDGFNLYKFRLGENKYNTIDFYLGNKGNNLYSINLDKNMNIIQKYKLNFKDNKGKKIILFLNNGKHLKLKLIKNNKIKNRLERFDYQIKCKKCLRIFSDKYSNFSSSFDKESGFQFYFVYSDENINTAYGSCYKL